MVEVYRKCMCIVRWRWRWCVTLVCKQWRISREEILCQSLVFDQLSSALDKQLAFSCHDTLSLISFLTASAKMHSHTQSAVPTVRLGCKYTTSQIHDQALCSFLLYDLFLYLKIFPELRGFIDLVKNRLRLPSPYPSSNHIFFHSLSSSLLSSLLSSHLSLPHFLPLPLFLFHTHFLGSVLPLFPYLTPKALTENVERRDLLSSVGKKGETISLQTEGCSKGIGW